ncbi:isoprenoid synthase domain-containing protein [Mycena metata]|uniref:(2E,6E)-farnesyl diphosphate synthase n=1 Tax=Mycena metata TaxID=1033252 RepID=A0AAD7JQB9_9AGAR|nr:isoprenoid synthase domain-containing protein [Mycena metata]
MSYAALPSSFSPTVLKVDEAVLEPFTCIISNPGKDIRTQLMAAFNVWISVPEYKLKIIAKVVSMLHNASLMVDDIEDDSQLRRGVVSAAALSFAHKIYGIPQTINTANYVYFLAYQELLLLSAPGSTPSQTELVSIITSELISLHRGQGLELLWRDSLTCPSEDQYVDMVNDKTGGLLRIGIKLLMASTTVNLTGVFFQIRDDYVNLQSGEYTSNKGFAEDLTEGKFSFPIVHGIHADRNNRQVLSAFPHPPKTPENTNAPLMVHTTSYLEKHTQSFSYTRSVLANLEQQIDLGSPYSLGTLRMPSVKTTGMSTIRPRTLDVRTAPRLFLEACTGGRHAAYGPETTALDPSPLSSSLSGLDLLKVELGAGGCPMRVFVHLHGFDEYPSGRVEHITRGGDSGRGSAGYKYSIPSTITDAGSFRFVAMRSFFKC